MFYYAAIRTRDELDNPVNDVYAIPSPVRLPVSPDGSVQECDALDHEPFDTKAAAIDYARAVRMSQYEADQFDAAAYNGHYVDDETACTEEGTCWICDMAAVEPGSALCAACAAQLEAYDDL